MGERGGGVDRRAVIKGIAVAAGVAAVAPSQLLPEDNIDEDVRRMVELMTCATVWHGTWMVDLWINGVHHTVIAVNGKVREVVKYE